MAYHDENGKITIDEQAAEKDIKRLQESAQILKDSREAIRNLQRQGADMQGETANAIIVKAQEMDKKLTKMLDKLEETAAYIRKTVHRYEVLDEQIKQAIQAAASVSDAVTATAAVSSKPVSTSNTSTSGSSGGEHTSGGGRKASAKDSDIGDTIKNVGKAASDFIGNLLDDFF